LTKLYARPLTIQKLNEERSKLCALKGGGAARWLKRLAPQVRAHVQVLSDVYPYGAEVVGSGPFWDGNVPHRIVADNGLLMACLRREAARMKLPVLRASALDSCSWSAWVTLVDEEYREHLAKGRSGVLIFGGEPSVDLS